MKYLINENLPEDISLWNVSDFVHAKTLGAHVDDGQIWNYAKERSLTIVSKGTDFSNRILVSNPPPRVIHMPIGNMKFHAFQAFITAYWPEILTISESHKLVNVYRDSIEGIH